LIRAPCQRRRALIVNRPGIRVSIETIGPELGWRQFATLTYRGLTMRTPLWLSVYHLAALRASSARGLEEQHDEPAKWTKEQPKKRAQPFPPLQASEYVANDEVDGHNQEQEQPDAQRFWGHF